jgi:hypothetical protein
MQTERNILSTRRTASAQPFASLFMAPAHSAGGEDHRMIEIDTLRNRMLVGLLLTELLVGCVGAAWVLAARLAGH